MEGLTVLIPALWPPRPPIRWVNSSECHNLTYFLNTQLMERVLGETQVFVHNPHTKAKREGERWLADPTAAAADVALLNFNQKVAALTTGTLRPGAAEEVLVIGTPNAVLAYDVENNCDLFYKEVR